MNKKVLTGAIALGVLTPSLVMPMVSPMEVEANSNIKYSYVADVNVVNPKTMGKEDTIINVKIKDFPKDFPPGTYKYQVRASTSSAGGTVADRAIRDNVKIGDSFQLVIPKENVISASNVQIVVDLVTFIDEPQAKGVRLSTDIIALVDGQNKKYQEIEELYKEQQKEENKTQPKPNPNGSGGGVTTVKPDISDHPTSDNNKVTPPSVETKPNTPEKNKETDGTTHEGDENTKNGSATELESGFTNNNTSKNDQSNNNETPTNKNDVSPTDKNNVTEQVQKEEEAKKTGKPNLNKPPMIAVDVNDEGAPVDKDGKVLGTTDGKGGKSKVNDGKGHIMGGHIEEDEITRDKSEAIQKLKDEQFLIITSALAYDILQEHEELLMPEGTVAVNTIILPNKLMYANSCNDLYAQTDDVVEIGHDKYTTFLDTNRNGISCDESDFGGNYDQNIYTEEGELEDFKVEVVEEDEEKVEDKSKLVPQSPEQRNYFISILLGMVTGTGGFFGIRQKLLNSKSKFFS